LTIFLYILNYFFYIINVFSEYILNDILSYDDRFFLKQNHQSYKDLFLQIEINNLFKIKNLINHYLKLCIFYSKYKYHGDDFSYYNTLIQNIEHLFLNNNIINNIKIYFLSISKEETKLIVFVADNGMGIDDAVKEKIFQPNFSTKSYGTGLGLAMCKRIIEQHSGTIWFDSAQGKGTTFYFAMPV